MVFDNQSKVREHVATRKHSGIEKDLLAEFLDTFIFLQKGDKMGEDRSVLRTNKTMIQLLNEFRSFSGIPNLSPHILQKSTIGVQDKHLSTR